MSTVGIVLFDLAVLYGTSCATRNARAELSLMAKFTFCGSGPVRRRRYGDAEAEAVLAAGHGQASSGTRFHSVPFSRCRSCTVSTEPPVSSMFEIAS